MTTFTPAPVRLCERPARPRDSAGLARAAKRAGDPIRVAFAGQSSRLGVDDGLVAIRAIELVFDQVDEAGRKVRGSTKHLDPEEI